MKVLYYAIGKEPEVIEIAPTLKSMQETVGGYIETLTLSNGVVVVCNEEGKLLDLPLNRTVFFSPRSAEAIMGNFFVCEAGDEDFKDISSKGIEYAKEVIV